jgi:hypothetical protein
LVPTRFEALLLVRPRELEPAWPALRWPAPVEWCTEARAAEGCRAEEGTKNPVEIVSASRGMWLARKLYAAIRETSPAASLRRRDANIDVTSLPVWKRFLYQGPTLADHR